MLCPSNLPICGAALWQFTADSDKFTAYKVVPRLPQVARGITFVGCPFQAVNAAGALATTESHFITGAWVTETVLVSFLTQW